MTTTPFRRGDRLFNTGNKSRKIIGIVTGIVNDEYCKVLWSDGENYAYEGTIRRDGSVDYGVTGLPPARIVRVKLSVRIPAEEVSE